MPWSNSEIVENSQQIWNNLTKIKMQYRSETLDGCTGIGNRYGSEYLTITRVWYDFLQFDFLSTFKQGVRSDLSILSLHWSSSKILLAIINPWLYSWPWRSWAQLPTSEPIQ